MTGQTPVQASDRLGRPLRSLRISVTDRCNLRCRYCLPAEVFGPDFAFLPRSEVLSYEEIVRAARAFARLGVKAFKITGGEPLLRRDLPVLISQLRSIGKGIDLSLTTNGLRLAACLSELKAAGLGRINISLDALDAKPASLMAGRDLDPEQVWKAVLATREAGLGVKVNTVIKRGINESQILPLAKCCRESGVPLRFIEYMDVGTRNDWHREAVFSGREVLDRLREQWGLEPVPDPVPGETARRFRYRDGSGEVGFINSISEPFCRSCGRARIAADGTLYTCLFAETGINLKPWLRHDQLNTPGLTDRLLRHWQGRHDRYSEERGQSSPRAASGRPEMWAIGG